MADTTIKVDSAVRDRLAQLAAERGLTMRDFVDRLASSTPTQAELEQRRADAIDYVTTHLLPGFKPEDVEAGERFWQSIEARQHETIGQKPRGGHAA